MSESLRHWLKRAGVAALLALLFWAAAVLASETPPTASLGVDVHTLGLANYGEQSSQRVAPVSNRIVSEANQDAQAFSTPLPADLSTASSDWTPQSGPTPATSPSSTAVPPSATPTPTASPAAATTAAGPAGWIQGKIQDSSNSQGITGALVQTSAGSTTTDTTGAYQLTLPASTYNVIASASGYNSQTQTVIVVGGSGVKLNFSLTPITVSPGTIDGTVYNSQTGVGIAGAQVVLSNGMGTSTSSSGFYVFGTVPPGTYTVTASASGLQSASASVSVTSGHNTVLNLKLKPLATTGSIVGTVKGPNGKGISAATVTLGPGNLSAVTDSSGYYAFASVLPGTYTVSVSAPGYLSQSATVTVQAGRTVKANFSLTPA